MNADSIAALQARGDLAVTGLQAIRSASQNAQIRLLQTIQRMQKMNLPLQTADGKPTIANILFSELEILNTAVSDIFALSNTVVLELDALASQHGVGRSHAEVTTDVVNRIRASSQAYADKTDAEIRKEFGL